jgi:hypothetical protein
MNMKVLSFVYSLNETVCCDRIERTNKIVYVSGDGIPRMELFTAWICVPSRVTNKIKVRKLRFGGGRDSVSLLRLAVMFKKM